MTLLFSRFLAVFTLFSYLVVGTVAVRVLSTGTSEFSFSLDYFSIIKSGSLEGSTLAVIVTPDYEFNEIKQPAIKDVVVIKAAKIAERIVPEVKIMSLPFHETIVLKKIEVTGQPPSNLIALYRPVPEEIVEMVAKSNNQLPITHSDEVTTQMAKADIVEDRSDEEPVFLDYANEEVVTVAPAFPAEITAEPVRNWAVENKSDSVDKAQAVVDNSIKEVQIDDLFAFDYSSAQKEIGSSNAPVITKVTIHNPKKAKPSLNKAKPSINNVISAAEDEEDTGSAGFMQEEVNSTRLSIQVTGTDLDKAYKVKGFELRFQDDLSEMVEDYGSGQIDIKEKLAQASMTRSVLLLKKGFVPTHTGLILENGAAEISLPLLEAGTFNELIAPFESRGPVGAIMIEMDDETEDATIDVPFGKIIRLDGDFKITTRDDFRYQVLIGVQAGNAFLSYKDSKGKTVSKIVHVHESEMSYETNIYEPVKNETVSLFEEDLLARENAPLIIGAEHVRKFASTTESKKINDHTYKVNFDRHLLANRRYLELSHLDEPIFVGVRDRSKIIVPSENFMRFVLSRLEGAKLGNRCLVQVNLSRKISRVDIGTESVANSLMTYTQMLDSDGKFYDSAGEKTRKVIIVGENQGAPEYSQDSKINVKISYEDGSIQYLNSYCSPNSYIVEQL